MQISDLPALNAFLNSCATVCLILGYWFIKQGKKEAHIKTMLMALGFSTVFLASYLVYHYHAGSKLFPDLGWIKTIYLIVLVTHIILAAGMVPLIGLTFIWAFRQNFEKHKKWAKPTLAIWLYVSITGVLIYFALYHWFNVAQ